MPNSHHKESPIQEQLHSWVLFATSREEVIKIQKEVDSIFSNYSFYPEIDWGKYGYRPPESYQVLGAWRHQNSTVFAFLLDNPYMITFDASIQLILYIAGEKNEITTIETKLDTLKSIFNLKNKREEVGLNVEKRLERFQTSKSFKTFAKTLGLITTIINVFSLYLRKLPIPNFNNQTIADIYTYSVASIHFAALLLLFVVIVICIIFFIKYGVLFIRRI